jgi:hypothetical protein
MRWILPLLLLLAGCTITPEDPDELPEGYADPKEDLVEHLKDHPNDLDSHADLLRMQIKDGDAEGAGTTVGHALKHNGGDYRAHLLAAQFHRWQADLISAEKSLLTARDLAPDKLEPRVALSGLYNQTYLEAEELEQRRIALELADATLRSEFLLDFAYANADLGHDDQAAALASQLLADGNALAGARSRAHVLMCEISLRASRETDAATHLLSALKLEPKSDGLLQYTARLVTVVEDGSAFAQTFDKALETEDRAEPRWAALFGKWMLSVQAASKSAGDPLAGDADTLYRRLDAVSPSHPDVLSRRYQLLALDKARATELEAAAAQLEEIEFGKPATPATLTGVLRLWRAEDALRLNAPNITLDEITQLEVREPTLEGMRVMRTMALFKARENEHALDAINKWIADAGEQDEFLLAMRWWILLRTSRSKEVLDEITRRTEEPSNASLWIEAVAKFHVYRGG